MKKMYSIIIEERKIRSMKKYMYMVLGAAFATGVVFGIKTKKEITQTSEDCEMLKEYLINNPIPPVAKPMSDIDVEIVEE